MHEISILRKTGSSSNVTKHSDFIKIPDGITKFDFLASVGGLV